MIRSYASSYTLGHNHVKDIFDGDVTMTEKVDGSQFSMAVINGVLECRSKRHPIDIYNPVPLFEKAVETARQLESDLQPGWVYRCEYLATTQQNTLIYGRVPKNYLVLFDIDTGIERYLDYDDVMREATRLNIDCAPLIYYGHVDSIEQFKNILDRESFLGGTKIEGVAIKNYARMTAEKKLMLATYVSPQFKEDNAERWRTVIRPGQNTIVEQLIARYTTEARWQKAVQHLNEAGELEYTPRDIGKLVKEIPADVLADSEEDIKQALFAWAWPKIQRGLTKDFPVWYKDQLLERQFDDN